MNEQERHYILDRIDETPGDALALERSFYAPAGVEAEVVCWRCEVSCYFPTAGDAGFRAFVRAHGRCEIGGE
jgi:hypothetical protein